MSRERESFNEINITPLTDIFLVLLIIMMVIAPLLDQQGLNLTVPDMVEQTQVKENKTMTIAVTNDDKYVFDGQEIAPQDLEALIKDKAKSLPDGLLIESAPEATHGAVVKLMDSARNSGVTSISMSAGG
ncbi:MAG: biopolymer transporter ExbD [Candidatus Gastranaerophilales bacterium]|nr:biopolymer transporter ExbD [Candidatus Gastranaerophilales bacterium]